MLTNYEKNIITKVASKVTLDPYAKVDTYLSNHYDDPEDYVDYLVKKFDLSLAKNLDVDPNEYMKRFINKEKIRLNSNLKANSANLTKSLLDADITDNYSRAGALLGAAGLIGLLAYSKPRIYKPYRFLPGIHWI